MKLVALIILYFVFSYPAQGRDNCEDIDANFYWFNSLVNKTTILEDTEDLRIWYVNSDKAICYKAKQREIQSPGTIYTGYVMALRELGNNINPENLAKIKRITGIRFKDSAQFNYWFNMNSKNLFWSFEKNRLTVLPDGFRCNNIMAAGGMLYWFNYSLGSAIDMDTSSDSRLWSDAVDNTKCFISPLSEVNDHKIQIQGFRLALDHVGPGNDEIRKRIINRFNLLTNNNPLLIKELTGVN